MDRILIARLDNVGDVVLAGPAVRAAAQDFHVDMLCGPSGAEAARLLPGVDDVVVWESPWTGFSPPPVDRAVVDGLIDRLTRRRYRAAAILTSFHQSPLPLALLLRMAEVGEIAAVSVDYPGSLLDHRLAYREDLHEVEQALAVVGALGCEPDGDDLVLDVPALPTGLEPGYVVVHPGASVPSRALPPGLTAEVCRLMAEDGDRVVVTGTPADQAVDVPSHPLIHDRRGTTTLAQLCSIIAGADAVVAGNTGPAHIAAATGTPVVSVFAPVVDPSRWRPWRVPAVVLGTHDVACAGCRARRCPFPVQHCVADVRASQVVGAVDEIRRTAIRRAV